MSYLTRAYGAVKLFTTNHAPTILVVSGVASMTAGAVLGAKKTLQVEEVLAKHAPDLENIEKGEALALGSYTPEVARADRLRVYGHAALDLGQLYAVPGVMFVGGAVLVFSGHRIMLQRNATLAIAFTGLKKTFDAYRARVVNQYGTEADQAFYGGYDLKQIVDEKTGDVKTIAVRDWEEARNDPYNRVFEQGASSEWQPDLGANKLFVANQQRMAQILLGQRGYLYLSEVYEALGFPETDISRVVGWKEKRLPDGSRDIPMIDFGLDKPHPDDWKYTPEAGIYLDFNCQGLIIGGKVQRILEKA